MARWSVREPVWLRHRVPTYEPAERGADVLYRVVEQHLDAFVDRSEASGRPPPPTAGAGCGSSARPDLCGGRPATGVPTATATPSGLPPKHTGPAGHRRWFRHRDRSPVMPLDYAATVRNTPGRLRFDRGLVWRTQRDEEHVTIDNLRELSARRVAPGGSWWLAGGLLFASIAVWAELPAMVSIGALWLAAGARGLRMRTRHVITWTQADAPRAPPHGGRHRSRRTARRRSPPRPADGPRARESRRNLDPAALAAAARLLDGASRTRCVDGDVAEHSADLGSGCGRWPSEAL